MTSSKFSLSLVVCKKEENDLKKQNLQLQRWRVKREASNKNKRKETISQRSQSCNSSQRRSFQRKAKWRKPSSTIVLLQNGHSILNVLVTWPVFDQHWGRTHSPDKNLQIPGWCIAPQCQNLFPIPQTTFCRQISIFCSFWLDYQSRDNIFLL